MRQEAGRQGRCPGMSVGASTRRELGRGLAGVWTWPQRHIHIPVMVQDPPPTHLTASPSGSLLRDSSSDGQETHVPGPGLEGHGDMEGHVSLAQHLLSTVTCPVQGGRAAEFAHECGF